MSNITYFYLEEYNINMKSVLLFFFTVIFIRLIFNRLLQATSIPEKCFAIILIVLLCLLLIYLIFEKKIKNHPAFIWSYEYFQRNKIKVLSFAYIFALLILEGFFLSHTPENSIINKLRISVMIFCGAGIILLIINLKKHW